MQQFTKFQMAAIDYLTVTTKTDVETAVLLSELLSLKSATELYKLPNYPWSFKGFKGRAFEGMRYGVRGEEGIVMLSGETCQHLWEKVAPLRSKCTRIDMAVTITLADRDIHVAQDAYTEFVEASTGVGSIVTSSKGGSTAYVGSRQSQFMGRIYDKGAEQAGEVGMIWRYELECKKPQSEAIVARLLQTEDVSAFIFSYVSRWFESRGISPRWLATGVYDAIELQAEVSTPNKQLEWLRTQVRPTVGKLINAGLEESVREALALPAVIQQHLWKEM